QFLAVLGDVEELVLRNGSGRGAHVNLHHSRQRGGLGSGDFDLDLRPPDKKVTDVSLKCRLIERGFFVVGGMRQGERQRRQQQESKRAKHCLLLYTCYIMGPIRHGTNSLCPRRSAQVFLPEATSSSRSKISWPTWAT